MRACERCIHTLRALTMPLHHMHMILIGAAHASLSLRSTAPSQFSPRPSSFRRRLDAPRSCICINCKWIDRCEVYHWVEKQHEQPHVTDSPDFEPVEPQGAQPWPARALLEAGCSPNPAFHATCEFTLTVIKRAPHASVRSTSLHSQPGRGGRRA